MALLQDDGNDGDNPVELDGIEGGGAPTADSSAGFQDAQEPATSQDEFHSMDTSGDFYDANESFSATSVNEAHE